MIKRISIHGLRGFGKEKIVEFAMPSGKEGSGITFLVGSNNSGKTTILEALRYFNCYFHDAPSLSEKKRNKKCEDGKVHLWIEDNENTKFSIDTSNNGGSPTILKVNGEEKEELWNPPTVFVLQSRRFVEYEFHRNEMSRFDYLKNQQNNYFNRSSVLNEFNSRLFNMFNHKEDFDKVLKKILGYDLKWTIERNENGSYYLKLTINGCEHSSEGLGDGIWSIFTICDALYDSQEGDTIAIDEPELSLHPYYQKKILNLIKEYSKDRQIIISTHSSYFVDLNSIINGAKLYRTIKDKEANIDVYGLSAENRKDLKGFVNDINQPHTFGIEAKELFFLEDKIILVEGQEDVIMYSKAAKSLAIDLMGDFFGWGAGGAPKVPKLLKLFRKLGYKKVAIILDGDKQEDMETLQKEYPEYNFFIIPTDDIRDKDAIINRPGKEGMMTTKGELKSEYREDMRKLLMGINSSF